MCCDDILLHDNMMELMKEHGIENFIVEKVRRKQRIDDEFRCIYK